MTDLETGMAVFISVFDKYACAEGKKDTLSKAELKTMLDKEMPGLITNAKGKDECGQLLRDLDDNGDCEIQFPEFMTFIAAFTCLCHERFQHKQKK